MKVLFADGGFDQSKLCTGTEEDASFLPSYSVLHKSKPRLPTCFKHITSQAVIRKMTQLFVTVI